MVQVTPFFLVLSLALGAHSFSVEKCNLTGNWTNDLGSNMTILAVDEKGNFAGLYNTSVADHPNKIQQSPLVGFLHLTNPIDQPTFGFTVNWTFSDSITVFTGQCFLDKDGKETLKTMWLLRSRMDNIENDWKATRVGTNIFTRVQSQRE
ncbi:avidin-like [Manacus candei]|uniref:avidin-like n=1 Tax=Manacus candei TaxID=415023 RepID=UPI0022264FA3|nr:avidin-like [Manacus candei]